MILKLIAMNMDKEIVRANIDDKDDGFWSGAEDELSSESSIISFTSGQLTNEHVPHDREKLTKSMVSTRGRFFLLMQLAENV